MPELSKPLIAVIGVLVSIAILFIAVLGILPFLQGTISSTSQTSQFSVVASASTTSSGGSITKVIFTVTVQKLAGTGSFQIASDNDILVFSPGGDKTHGGASNVVVSPSMPQSFSQALTFTLEVSSNASFTLTTGNWALTVTLSDSNGNPVQIISVSVPVS